MHAEITNKRTTERRDPDISRSSTTHYPDWDKINKEYVVPPKQRKEEA